MRPTIAQLLEVLRRHDVELVLLAGYMKIVTTVLVEAYANRMMNIHPSLLPSFPGLDVQKKGDRVGLQTSRMYRPLCHGRCRRRADHRSGSGSDPRCTIRPTHWPLAFSNKNTGSTPVRSSSLPKGACGLRGRRVFIEPGKPDGEAVISPS